MNNYNNKDSGPNQRRSDVGQRVLWEPIPSSILKVLFNDPGLRFKILKVYTGSIANKVDWEEDKGFFTFDSSSKLQILVTRPESRKELKELLDNYILLRDSTYEKSHTTGDNIVQLQEVFADDFSRLVTLSSVISFESVSKDVGTFVKQHWGQNGQPPMFTFEGNVGTDSGSRAGVNIYSVPSSTSGTLNANFPGTTTVSKRDARKRAESNTGSSSKGIAMALAFLDVDEEDPNDTVIHDSQASAADANVASESISQKDGGSLKISSSKDESAPDQEIGGPSKSIITREEFRSHGTHTASYSMDGTVTNPSIGQPSAFFYPNQSVIRNIFSPLASVTDNPYLIIGLIALVSQSDDSPNHTIHYKNLPQKVTDNQEIKDKLIGD